MGGYGCPSNMPGLFARLLVMGTIELKFYKAMEIF